MLSIITHPIKTLERVANMGVYTQLAKIEALIEANTDVKSWSWTSGWIAIDRLPKPMFEALLQFGYSKKAPFFGVNCRIGDDVADEKKHDILCISFGKNHKDWTDLLYKDVDRDWRTCWDLDSKNPEENRKCVDTCYKKLQKFFMFMNIYLKKREEMVKVVNIEYDEVQSSLDDI